MIDPAGTPKKVPVFLLVCLRNYKVTFAVYLHMKKVSTILFLLLLVSTTVYFSSCNENYTPKPKGYFRIDLPEKEYKLYDPLVCPFSFEIPVYSRIEPYRDSTAQPCWKYLLFDRFNGQLFLSYVNAEGKLNDYLEESRKLVYKHTVKADAINETFIETPHNAYGIIYDIGGNAASSVQFFVTDSTRHFLRGALYFNTSPQPDSLAPVIDFLRKDIVKMIHTLQWKK